MQELENLRENIQSPHNPQHPFHPLNLQNQMEEMEEPVPIQGEVTQAPRKKRARKQSPKSPPNPFTDGLEKSAISADVPPSDLKPKREPNAKLIEDVANLYTIVGVGIMPFDQFAGTLICSTADERAREHVNAARHNKAWLNALKRITKSSDIGAFAFGHAMMVYAILAVRGLIPANGALLGRMGIQVQPQYEDATV